MQNFKSLEILFSKASYISRKGRPPSWLGMWWPGVRAAGGVGRDTPAGSGGQGWDMAPSG